MAKEKFERTNPHVNVGTIGPVPHNSASDNSDTSQYDQSDYGFVFERAVIPLVGLVVLILLIGGAFLLFGNRPTTPADAPPFKPALITEIDFPAADITLERGYTAQDDLWKWAALDCVPDYEPLAHTACVETDTTFPVILAQSWNDPTLPNCQPPTYALDPEHANILPPGRSAQAEEQFFTIELLDSRVIATRPQSSDSGNGSDVAIDMISLSYESIDISYNAAAIPLIVVLYDTALPDFRKGGEIIAADFNYEVMLDLVPTNSLFIEPQIDPDSGEIVAPSLALLSTPDGPLLVDLSNVPPDQDGELLALMRFESAANLFPPQIPPLCSTLLSESPVETEEPTDESASNVPVSTEEPVDQQTAVCGDLVCDPNTENTDLCSADCPCVDDGVCRAGEGESCQDCGASAGACGATCADSSQCAEGLSCAGGICWDTATCGSDPGSDSGGGSGGDDGGGESCPCQVVCLERDRDGNCIRRTTQDCNGNACTP